MRKSFFFVVVMTSFFVVSTNNSLAESKKYYLLNIFYNKIEDSIKLTGDQLQDPTALTDLNFTRDIGEGSQFYAQVLDSKKELQKKNGNNKFFLGKWMLVMFWDGVDEKGDMTGGSEEMDEGEVRVSVPYFPDGQVIEIRKTFDDSLALSIDVEKFAEEETSVPQIIVTESSEKKNTGNNWIMFGVLGFIGIIVLGGGYWIYRKRKNS